MKLKACMWEKERDKWNEGDTRWSEKYIKERERERGIHTHTHTEKIVNKNADPIER